MKYLLDGDSTIDHLYHVIARFADIPNLAPEEFALGAASLIELYTGVCSSSNPRQAERNLKRFLRAITVAPLNQRVIHATARLRSVILSRKGAIRHRAYDLITAATALEYGLTVVTSNTRDYQDIAGLTTYDPRTGSLVTH